MVLSRHENHRVERHFASATTTSRPRITVTTDGHGVASHAGSRLLADLADRTGLTQALSEAVGGLRRRRAGHDPGRVLVDVAVMLADGGRGISGLAVLRDRPELFGSVASTATAWRVLDGIDPAVLAELRTARARARERLWAQREATVGPIRASAAGGRDWPGLRLVVDATLVSCHSEKGGGQCLGQGRIRVSPVDGVVGQHQ